jgi:hypothetical protein
VVAEDGRLLLADLADGGRPDGAEPGRCPTAARSACSPSACSVRWLRPIRFIHAGVGLLTGAELGRPRPTAALRTGADAGRPGRIGGRLEATAAIPSDQRLRREQSRGTPPPQRSNAAATNRRRHLAGRDDQQGRRLRQRRLLFYHDDKFPPAASYYYNIQLS